MVAVQNDEDCACKVVGGVFVTCLAEDGCVCGCWAGKFSTVLRFLIICCPSGVRRVVVRKS